MVVAPIDAPGLLFNMTAINGTAAMKMHVKGWLNGGVVAIDYITSGTPILRNQWNRVFIPCKQTTNNKKIRVNGNDEALTVTTFNTTQPVVLNQGLGSDDIILFGLGAGNGVATGNFLVGAQYHPWFNSGNGAYFDDETKFWNGSGSPASLGANGETPTGSSPGLYFPNGPSTFQNNAGNLGNFTRVGSFAGIAPPT